MAYSAADIVVSRAGAIAISELCLTGKPSILIPSPNVAEDHQTKNALALSSRGAAILVKDCDAAVSLVSIITQLTTNLTEQKTLSTNISSMAIRNSARKIAEHVFELAIKGKNKAAHVVKQ